MTQYPMFDCRGFVVATSSLAASALLLKSLGSQARSPAVATVGDAIDLLISQSKGGVRQETVDTIKTGDREQTLKGVVTTFLPNLDVIRKAIETGANLIVSHEPIFYNRFDETGWLESNPVYQYKRQLICDNGIVVFRYHDYIHDIEPDPIRTTIAERRGWADRQSVLGHQPSEEAGMAWLSGWLKEKLNVPVSHIPAEMAFKYKGRRAIS